MQTYNIAINEIPKLKKFLTVMNKPELSDLTIDLVSGRHIVNAKSLMAILSLQLDKPVQCIVHTTDPDLIIRAKNLLDPFVISTSTT